MRSQGLLCHWVRAASTYWSDGSWSLRLSLRNCSDTSFHACVLWQPNVGTSTDALSWRLIKDRPLIIVVVVAKTQILVDDLCFHLPLLLLFQLPSLSLFGLLARLFSLLLLFAFLPGPLLFDEGRALAAELVLVLVLETNVLRANLALLRLAPAVDYMPIVVCVLKHLFAVEALLRSHRAAFLMALQVLLAQVCLAVLTGYLGMRLLVMLVFVGLSHDLTTSCAFVVAPGATDFVNAELSDVYFFLAGAAPLRRYWSLW